jgi:hypothetical protein
MRWIPREEAEVIIGTGQYASTAVTLEPSIDVVGFLDAMCTELDDDDRINIVDHDAVTYITRLDAEPDGARFLLRTICRGEPLAIRARNVNVCAWEPTEDLLAPRGYEFESLNRINRGFRLRLGEASLRFPSTIAVFGSHALFSRPRGNRSDRCRLRGSQNLQSVWRHRPLRSSQRSSPSGCQGIQSSDGSGFMGDLGNEARQLLRRRRGVPRIGPPRAIAGLTMRGPVRCAAHAAQ